MLHICKIEKVFHLYIYNLDYIYIITYQTIGLLF